MKHVIESFTPTGGKHCITHSLKQIFAYEGRPLSEASHFGGHAVVLVGYDDEQEVFYVSDRDHSTYPIRTPKGESASDYHLVSYSEMESARSSRHRPFPANNKFMEFDFTDYEEPNQATITAAIKDTCEAMLNPSAKLLGINGITKFSKEIIKWRSFDQRKLKTAGITNYFQISQDGGTGGGNLPETIWRVSIRSGSDFS